MVTDAPSAPEAGTMRKVTLRLVPFLMVSCVVAWVDRVRSPLSGGSNGCIAPNGADACPIQLILSL